MIEKLSRPAGRPSRIVFVNRFFYPDESATAQILSDLARHLSAEGRNVVVITSRLQGERATPLPAIGKHEGVVIRRVWSCGQHSLSLLSRFTAYLTFYVSSSLAMLRLVRSGDILVAKTDPPLIAVPALLVAKLRGAKLVNWLQDLYPEVAICLNAPLVGGSVGRILASLRDRALRGAVANVVIGRRMGERIESRGVSGQQIRFIPNWSDETVIRPLPAASSEMRKAWGLSANDFVLGYSGNLGKAHEARTMLDAAARLAHREDIRFLFVGGGHESRRLGKAVEERGLKGFIFRPHQPRERLGEALAVADAHWVSLRPELEGLIVPSKLYGILAAGRPVLAVTAARGEVGTVVREHGCGLVVEPGDDGALASAIERLADEPGLREKMGRSARRLAEESFAKRLALASWSELLSQLDRTR